MLNIIGQLLPVAVGIAISPIAIVGFILVLTGKDTQSKSLFVLLGWLIGLAVVAIIVLVLVSAGIQLGHKSARGGASIVTLLIGVGLVAFSYREWRHRPKPGEPVQMPKFWAKTGSPTPVGAIQQGIMPTIVNPKNSLANLGAAVTIGQAGLPPGQTVIVLIVYLILASLALLLPLAYVLLFGKCSEQGLSELNIWLVQNNATILAVIFLLLGTNLVGQSLSGLF